MANYIVKEMPDIRKSGKKQVYPKMQMGHLLDLDKIAELGKTRGIPFNAAMVRGIIRTITDITAEWIALGHPMKIDGLGVFTPSLMFVDDKGNELSEDDDRMAYRHVSVKSLNFRPDKDFVEQVREKADLVREVGGVQKLRVERYSKEERIERTKAYIEVHGSIRLGEYCSLNDLSRATASRELNAFCKDTDCPIVAKGKAPHKVWVLKE